MKSVFLLLLSVVAIYALKTCIPRSWPGKDPRIECICNATYCDEFPPLGTLTPGRAVIYTSSISGKRFERTEKAFGSSSVSKYKTINAIFDSTQKFQEIVGWGGAFTDAVGINLVKMNNDTLENFMQAYFGKTGIEYTTSRVPVASTDFSLCIYSYNEVPDDFNMTNFKLASEDYMYKIPFIKRAKQINPNLKLFSTPWSSPSWMKTNGNMTGRYPLKGSVGGKYYQAFALYYLKFFEAYHKEGIDFWGLTPLNEPQSYGGWQILLMTAEMERDFLKMNLGPLLKSQNLTKDLIMMIYDHNRPEMKPYVDTIMQDPEAAKYVDGLAVHYYEDMGSDPHLLTVVHDAYKDKFLLATEGCTGFTSSSDGGMEGDWGRALIYSYDIITDLQNYVAGWTDWNIALNEDGGPSWANNNVDAPITVKDDGSEFYKQPMYYALGHFTKFLQPGSIRIYLTVDSVSTDYFEHVGFVNSNNQNVAIFDNRQSTDTYTIVLKDKISGKSLTFDMEPRSYATIIWQ